MAEHVVQVSNASKQFGDKEALRSVSFCVSSGEICGLLGPNGAGKTTLFRLLMGILKASVSLQPAQTSCPKLSPGPHLTATDLT